MKNDNEIIVVAYPETKKESFFVNGERILMSEEFSEMISPTSEFSCSEKVFEVFLATERILDCDIPKKIVLRGWNDNTLLSELLGEIASLISQQLNGEDGPLLTNGNPNVFYLKGISFAIAWGPNKKVWYFHKPYRVGAIVSHMEGTKFFGPI